MPTEAIVAITSVLSVFLTAIAGPSLRALFGRGLTAAKTEEKVADVEGKQLDNIEHLKAITLSLLDPLNEKVRLLTAAQEESERKITALEGEIAGLKALLEAAKEKELDLTAANEELKLKNAQLERELDQARNEIERLQKRVADLEARRNAKK